MGKLDSIYGKLPVWAQHVAVSSYGAYWHWLRFGPGYNRYIADYKQRDAFTSKEWQTWQENRLPSFLRNAAESVPYYSQNWSREEKAAAFAGRLEDLPILEKDPVRTNPEAFHRQDVRSGRKLVFYSSGTTGTPISSTYTVSELRRSLALREVRSVGWAGASFKMHRATFSGRLVEPNADRITSPYRYNVIEGQAYLSPFHLRPDMASLYVDALKKHNIRWLHGYAVSYYLLASFILEQGLKVPPLEAVVTTSEKITPAMREVMQAAYGCEVYEEYSTVENTVFASQCEQGRLHVSNDAGIIEILRSDGTPCEPGEVGEVIGTGLLREYQPYIRYRLGDLAAWDPDICPCGRGLPVVQEVVGRIEDVVVGPDGREMVRFHGIFVDQPHLKEGQIIQETLDQIRVKVVATPGFGPEDSEDIIHRVQQRLGSSAKVVVEQVESIPRTESGKFKAVVSELANQHKPSVKPNVKPHQPGRLNVTLGKLENLYPRLPVWAQHAAISTYGVYWRWLRFGSGYGRYVEEYIEREKFNWEEWQVWQKRRLVEVLGMAATTVPYYMEAWSREEKAAAMKGELEGLPILDKDPIRQNPEEFIRQGKRTKPQLVFHTSGSTGTPIASIWTIQELRESQAVREARSLHWAGVSYKKRRGIISGRLVESSVQKSRSPYRFNLAEGQVYLSAFHLRPDTASQYVDALRKHNVKWLNGFAYSHYLLASFILEQGLKPPQIEAIVTTSEKLTPEMRRVIESAYGSRVYEEYSTVENTLFASECENGRLHVSPDVGVVEILRPDGTPCDPGETGEVVATALSRCYQPFIRFRVGDVAVWDPDQCTCGRVMPVIKEVVGRVEDVIVGPDGRQVVRLNNVFLNLPRLKEAQVIQEALDRLRVKVVVQDGFGDSEIQEITRQINLRLGTDMAVKIEIVDLIPRTSSGKFRAVISQLNDPPSTGLPHSEGNRQRTGGDS